MNTNIQRIPPAEGNYATVSNAILMNNNLTSDAIRLLCAILNNKENWNLYLSYYSKQFGWTEGRQAKAVNNLVNEGFMIVKRIGKGRNNGFGYHYTISERGDLNKEKETKEEVFALQPVIPSMEDAASSAHNQLVQPVNDSIAPTERDFEVFTNFMKEVNTVGCESAKRKMEQQVKQQFIAKFKRFDSDGQLMDFIGDIYLSLYDRIIKAEEKVLKPRVRYLW